MADINLTVQQITQNGIAPSYNSSLSVSNNYKVRNDGRVFLHFKKTGAGACTVTIVTPATLAGLAVADLSVNVPATTGDVMVGPFIPGVFNDQNGDVNFSCSEITGLSVAVERL
jgi:hypothetical protein